MSHLRTLSAALVLVVPPVTVASAATWHVDAASAAAGDGSPGLPWSDLQHAIDTAGHGDTLRLAAGVYRAQPHVFTEELCGNCQEHRTPVVATRGFLVADKALTIVGAGEQETELHTGAGYGVLFERSWGSHIEGVKITGGVRDADGNATDAGIVATGSSFMDATNNAVVRNGNCGLALRGDSIQGRFANNLVYRNGWRKQWVCPCVGIWHHTQPRDFSVRNNLVFANEAGDYKAVEFDLDKPGPPYDLTGQFGNLSVDPLLADTVTYRLLPGSPMIDAGDTLLTDLDGSRSDIGVYGGPAAHRD